MTDFITAEHEINKLSREIKQQSVCLRSVCIPQMGYFIPVLSLSGKKFYKPHPRPAMIGWNWTLLTFWLVVCEDMTNNLQDRY